MGLSLNASTLVKHVEPYGSQEHSQHHDCDVYGDPDCQYCQLASHIMPSLPSGSKPQGFTLHVSRESIAKVMTVTVIAIFIKSWIIISLIMLVPFLSVFPS
jgi:hypothetical protein